MNQSPTVTTAETMVASFDTLGLSPAILNAVKLQ
ncbi:MAG: hypothetical protein RJB10_1956, partial [Pseudomonadota bacterium]